MAFTGMITCFFGKNFSENRPCPAFQRILQQNIGAFAQQSFYFFIKN
jgi:hypothetical protein